MDRRTTVKWLLAASAPWAFVKKPTFARQVQSAEISAYQPVALGYGTDPKPSQAYRRGEFWALTFTPQQRRIATALSDLIIPADSESPSASMVGVVDFLDEWISAPYAEQQQDRRMILEGFEQLERESSRRFEKSFELLEEAQKKSICDDICYAANAKPEFAPAARFFARYRDLTAGGFYTTPEGRNDLKYMGNTPLARFDGPPPEVLRKVGLL